MKKALIIAAHPDDETLGCGGIISRFSDSTEFKVVFISEGTSCRYERSMMQQSLQLDHILRLLKRYCATRF